MAVAVNIPRGGVEISWEPGDYVGPVVIRATNVENGDIGIAKSENDGKAMLTWPPGTYTDAIVVYQDQQVEIDPDDPPHPDHTLPEVPRPVDPDYGIDEGAHPDHELPGDQPHPDHELPGDQPRPDHTLPGIGDGALPRPEHPIVLPPMPDDPHVEHHLVAVIDSGVITVTVT